MYVIHSGKIKSWAPPSEIEASAMAQLARTATIPNLYRHVAVMPDVHGGIGCTVGTVLALQDAVCPAAVGVDIGCGMTACSTSLYEEDLPDSLASLRNAIEDAIPTGFAARPTIHREVRDSELFDHFDLLDERVHHLRQKALHQCGTLGGGNHFIEICLDTNNRVWLMLHSGSRNIGKSIADVHISTAKAMTHNADLADPDLATLLAASNEFAAYRRDVTWAQLYARLSRSIMMSTMQDILTHQFASLDVEFGPAISCHHNYLSEEIHYGESVYVTRKGAISAREGEYGIIPGSMGARSFIVRGKGNPESYHSASHGAGRRMSRGEAKRHYSLADLAVQTHGVECRKDAGVIDEIPGAYKDIDQVMRQQSDLVEVVATLKQILCVKG